MKYAEKDKQLIKDKILELMVENDLPVRQAIKKVGISTSTFYLWLEDDEVYSKRYARAYEIAIENMADEILAIADENSNDYIINENGNPIVNKEAIQRANLKIETRKWLMAKRMSGKYGNKTDVTTNGESVNQAINVTWGTMDAKKK